MNVVKLMPSILIAFVGIHSAWAARRPPDNVKRFAIVIGVNDSGRTQTEQGRRARLRYADDDAVATHQLLTQAGVHSYLLVTLDENSHRLYPRLSTSGAPTENHVFEVFNRIAKETKKQRDAGEKTEFYLYYSGHGDVENGEGYVVLEGGKLTRTMLQERIIARSPAHYNHVIIDACKSYFLIFDKGPGGERRAYPFPFAPQRSSKNQNNTGYILSSSSERDSHEWERYQAGVFSHEMRSALRGGADVNLDGHVTYGEIGAFVSTANKDIVNERFRPQVFIHPPGNPPGDFSQSLLDWVADSSILLVDTPRLGHFYLEDEEGVRILDVHPKAEQKLRLHLPAPRPVFVRDALDKQEGGVETGGLVTLSYLTLEPVQVTSKGAAHLAFDKLFNTPLGAENEVTYVKERQQEHRLQLEYQQQEDRRLSREKVQKNAALWTAIGSAAVGGVFTFVAVGKYVNSKDGSQEDIVEANKVIRNLNITSTVFYSVAGIAGAYWLILQLWPKKKSNALSITTTAAPDGFILILQGSFGE